MFVKYYRPAPLTKGGLQTGRLTLGIYTRHGSHQAVATPKFRRLPL